MITVGKIHNKALNQSGGRLNCYYFKYIFALLLFGSNGVVASQIDLSSYEIVLLRTLIGGLLLFAIFFLTKNKLTFYRHKKQFLFLTVSGMAMGGSWMLLYEAYARVGVSIASLLYYCGPVIVMAVSPLLFKERLTIYKGIGFLSVLCGIYLINGNALNGKGDTFGILCGLLSAVLYSLMVISNKKAAGIVGLENAALQLLVSFITVAIFVGCKQGFAMNISSGDILPIFILGLLNTGVGCYFYFSSIGHMPVQTVALCGYLEPLAAVLCSVIFLKEAMLPIQIIGAVLILGGAIFGELFKAGLKLN